MLQTECVSIMTLQNNTPVTLSRYISVSLLQEALFRRYSSLLIYSSLLYCVHRLETVKSSAVLGSWLGLRSANNNEGSEMSAWEAKPRAKKNQSPIGQSRRKDGKPSKTEGGTSDGGGVISARDNRKVFKRSCNTFKVFKTASFKIKAQHFA